MSYIVLARKWRPRHFEEVVGQEHVARTLCNAIDQNRVAHAFLFCGPRGVGKTSTARILAKALNCAEGPTGHPCYTCASCQEISAGTSVDVFEIDGASNRGVNEIRELREGVRYAPGRDRHKIYIIDEVHMLTTEAFNALLKTLEEPPGHVKFIFATTEPQKIPVTILSRCQRFDFKRIPLRKIISRLEYICQAESLSAEPGALSLIARQADGGMRDALSLTDQVISFTAGQLTQSKVAEILGVASRELLFELSGALFTQDIETALRILDQISLSGHDMMQFASALVGHLRDLTVVKLAGEAGEMTDLTADELVTARAQADAVETSVLHRMFNLMVQAADDMSRSAFPKLIFEMTLVKLASIEPLMPIDLLLKRLEALESGLLIGDEDLGGGGGGPDGGPGGGHPGGGYRGGDGDDRAHHASATPARPPLARSAAPSHTPPPSFSERHTAPPSSDAQASRPLQEVRAVDPPAPPPRSDDKIVPFPRREAAPAPPEPVAALAPRPTPAAPPAQAQEHQGGAGTPPRGDAPPRPPWEDAPAPTPPRAVPSPDLEGPNTSRPEVADARHARANGHANGHDTRGDVRDLHEYAAPTAHADDANDIPDDWRLARASWRRLVEHLQPENSIASAWLVQARLKRLDPGAITLEFPSNMAGLVDFDRHSSLIAEAAHVALADLWDGRWEISFEVADDDDGDQAHRSLADEDAERLAARKVRAQAFLLNHELVDQARKIFGEVEIKIVLDDDEFYTRDLMQ